MGFFLDFNQEHLEHKAVHFNKFLCKVCAIKSERQAVPLSDINFWTFKHNSTRSVGVTSCVSDETRSLNFMSLISHFPFGILSLLLKAGPCSSFWYIFDSLCFSTTITRLLKMNFNHVLYAFLVIFSLCNSFQQDGILRNPSIELFKTERDSCIMHQLSQVHLKELTDTGNKHILYQLELGSLITF